MSNTIIIRDIIPIVVHHLNRNGANLSSETHIRDENLITFFEEELSKNFSICGSADHCKELEEAIKEIRERNEEEFYEYIKYLLNKYIHLQLKIRNAEKLNEKITIKQITEIFTDGKSQNVVPPDPFTNFRKKHPYGPERWIRKKEES